MIFSEVGFDFGDFWLIGWVYEADYHDNTPFSIHSYAYLKVRYLVEQ